MDDHSIAIQASAQKFVSRAPEIQPEAPIVKMAKAFDHSSAMVVKVGGPLSKSQEIALSIIDQLRNSHRCLCKLLHEIMQDQE
jgi:hypothetical protein